jgi:hypothetical protein
MLALSGEPPLLGVKVTAIVHEDLAGTIDP